MALTTQYRGTFLLVAARLSAMLSVAPVLGQRTVPAPHRIGLAVLLALILAPVLGPAPATRLGDGFGLLMAMAGEVFIGLAVGFVATLAVGAVQGAAEVVGFQMGLSIAAAYDPALGQQITPLGRLYEYVTLLLLLTVGAHHEVLRVTVATFQRIPPGTVTIGPEAGAGVAALGGKLFRSGLELAAPLIGVLFVVSFVMALLARVSPQLNLFTVGVPLATAAGIIGVVETLPHVFNVAARLFGELSVDVSTLLAGVSRGI